MRDHAGIYLACLVTLTLALAAGCAGKPFEYHSQQEIPRGSGAFSGEDGAWSWSDSDDEDEPEAVQTQSSEAVEYQAFEQWKSDSQNAADYQEFLEWRVWKAERALREHTQGN